VPKASNIRTRKYKPVRLYGRIDTATAANPGVYTKLGDGYTDLIGRQTTVSEGHHWPPPKGGLSDQGGPFSTVKSYVSDVPKPGAMQAKLFGTIPRKFTGHMVPNAFLYGTVDSLFPASAASSDDALNKLGATAIARCEPTNSVGNAATFLGELLKDGLPSLVGHGAWKAKTDAARKAGDEYLNVQFGWAPMVSDIQKFAYAIRHAHAVLSQYERDSGRVVRRKFQFPQTRTSSEQILSTNSTAYMVGASSTLFSEGSPGVLVKVVETTKSQWFSGAFTYYLPSDYGSRKGIAGLAAKADKLFGISLTPDTLWELTPWSWAVDWFSNTGDVIHNLQKFATGGLVMPYGYMMEHTIVKHSYILSKTGLLDKSSGLGPLTFVTESKKRIKANPFGFGLTWDGLSSFQASIAAALGLTKGRR